MHFFLKCIVTLFYKKLRIKIVVSLLRESGPRGPRPGDSDKRGSLQIFRVTQFMAKIRIEEHFESRQIFMRWVRRINQSKVK